MITIWKNPTPEGTTAAADHVLAPHVSLVLAHDGTARLLDMGGGFYALPILGAQMLQGALERGRDATVQELAHRYHVAPGRVRADLDSLLQQLTRHGLLRRGQRRGRDSGRALALVLVPCLCLIRALSYGRLRATLVLTLAKLALVCFGWARTVTVWQIHLRRFAPPAGAPVGEQTVRFVDEVVRQKAAGH